MDSERFLTAVKLNCNVSDAQAWGYYSICGLLMRLRELFRSEHGMLPWDDIPAESISAWIQDRESLWKELEGRGFGQLPLGNALYGPFDVDGVNRALRHEGLVYASGYGLFHKPGFFVARLVEVRELLDYSVHYCGRELCRDLSASPAMLQGRCIYLRIEVLRAIVWDKFQTLRSRREGGLLGDLFLRYGIRKNSGASDYIEQGIDLMTTGIADLFVMHEVGEAFEDDHSDEWLSLVSAGFDKYDELYLRAIKDLLADTSDKGPINYIFSRQDELLLHAYMVFLEGIRKEVFPEFGEAFLAFNENGDWAGIDQARLSAYKRAAELREMVLELWRLRKDAGDGVRAVDSCLRDAFGGSSRSR